MIIRYHGTCSRCGQPTERVVGLCVYLNHWCVPDRRVARLGAEHRMPAWIGDVLFSPRVGTSTATE